MFKMNDLWYETTTSYQSQASMHKSQSVLSHHIHFFPTKTMMAEILNSRLLKYG